jgi:hypothetical protein
MGEVPPPSTDETVRVPVPRDPPLPPGYVDPLDGSAALDDLVPVEPARRDDEPSGRAGEQPPRST